MYVKRLLGLWRIEHAQRVAGMEPPLRNDSTSIRWWERGQPLALPESEATPQHIGDKSNELVDPENLCIGFGISTLSSIERKDITTSGRAVAILRFFFPFTM